MEITTESIREQIPYYLTQDAKEHLVKALERFPREIDYYVDRYQDEFLQGDGWTSVEVVHFESSEQKFVKAVLFTNSCDVAPENKRDFPAKLTFAPLINLNRYLENLHSAGLDRQRIKAKEIAIKEQKVASLFYLPKGAGLDNDYVALLDNIHAVPSSGMSLVQ